MHQFIIFSFYLLLFYLSAIEILQKCNILTYFRVLNSSKLITLIDKVSTVFNMRYFCPVYFGHYDKSFAIYM